MPAAIADASPLIYLPAISRLSLLDEFFDRVLAPPAVWREVVKQGKGKQGTQAVVEAERGGRIERIGSVAPPALRPFENQLEPGEVEAIGASLEREDAVLLIDEHAGRRVADELGLRFTGTVGLLLRAEREGRITDLRPELDRLREEAGFWIADDLYERVLESTGERRTSE